MKSDGVDLATPTYQANAHLVDIKMIMDTMPNLNKTLCSGTKLFDSGYDLHFVHPSKPLYRVPDGFTGAFNRLLRRHGYSNHATHNNASRTSTTSSTLSTRSFDPKKIPPTHSSKNSTAK